MTEPFCEIDRRSRDRDKTLSELARLKDLRVLHQSCRKRIEELEKQARVDPEEVERERQVARAVKSEIKSLERSLTWGQLGRD